MLVKACVCSECGSTLNVKEDLVTRRGLVSKISLCCTNPECNKETPLTNPYDSEAKSLNARSLLAAREIGRGQTSLMHFCGMMDMLPPLGPSTFSDRNRDLAKVAMGCAEENMRTASDQNLAEFNATKY